MAKIAGGVRSSKIKQYSYVEFAKAKPVLYGSIMVNGKQKIG